MKILVTGAQGYIGTSLVSTLAVRGHKVVGLDAGFYAEGCLYEIEAERPPELRKDIRNVTEDDLRGLDAIIHLAELSNDPLARLDSRVTYDINHVGSVNLARTCKRAGVPRFIYTSSCSVYGIGSGEYKTEVSELTPQTPYAYCKILVERDVTRLADDNFTPTFLRNATAYGPSARMRFDLVLNNLAGQAWTTGVIKMTSDGTPYRPLVHVLDICTAIACTVEAPRELVHREVFNVGHTRENYQVKELAEIVADTFPKCKVTLGSDEADRRSYRVSFDKIQARLPGFKIGHDAVGGIRELRGLFEQIGLTREIFESRLFTRVRQLEYLLNTGQIDENFLWR